MSASNIAVRESGSLSRRTVFTVLYKGMLSIIAFAGSVAAARYLTKSDRLQFQLSGTFATTGNTYMGGYAYYYSFQLPRLPEDAQAVSQMGNVVFFLLSLLIWLALFIITQTHVIALPPAYFWAVLCTPLAFLLNYGTRLLQGANAISWLNRANMFQPLVFLIVFLAIALTGRGLPEADRLRLTYGVWMFSFAFAAAACLAVAYQVLGWSAAKWHFYSRHWRGMLNYGTWYSLSNLVNYVNYRVDMWIVAILVPGAIASLYAVGVATSEVLLNISGAVGSVVFTRMTSGPQADAIRLTQISAKQTLVSSALVASLMYAVFPWFIPLAYGSRYAGAVAPFLILLPGVIFRSTGNILIQYATNSLASPKTAIWMNGVAGTITGVLSIALIPVFGMLGAATASSLSYFVTYFAYAVWFRRKTGTDLRDLWPLRKSDYAPYWRAVRRLLRRPR